MKKILLVITLSCMAITACSTSMADQPIHHLTKVRSPYLNQQEFTGLVNVGDDLANMTLDYALDSPTNIELPLNSCTVVNATSETDVKTSQHHLLQLMLVNCLAAKYYFSALTEGDVSSYFPDSVNEKFVKSLPAILVPDLGGESLDNRLGSLLDIEPNLKVIAVNENAVELSLAGDLVVNYVPMARGDFNGDGIEDMLLRLDWYISSAFGKGFDLVMVTQLSNDSQPQLLWRR